MPDSLLTNSKIIAAYREKTRKSSELAEKARETFPSGITHDSRHTDPYGIYVDHAKGSRKWDVDGNEYVDFFGGHGALILGHNHSGVIDAGHVQLDKGTHFGAGHPAEVEWGGLVKEMVPCAERVRFTSSGTEANLMAFRLARASMPYMRDVAKAEMADGRTPADRAIINVSSTSGLHGNVGQANY
ncbi:MAG: aminotransferase class III-fold pyridoxal phosphate-dependent enzyme, partial [Pseudomonadota bacterium]|nr:aminotransferase class III-fold pyridoxal phosphate-dependent enzyme [Pseudomonadota bacterium]